jgi:hypothetical protein
MCGDIIVVEMSNAFQMYDTINLRSVRQFIFIDCLFCATGADHKILPKVRWKYGRTSWSIHLPIVAQGAIDESLFMLFVSSSRLAVVINVLYTNYGPPLS